MTDAVLRVRADAAQARGVLGGLTTDIKGVGDGTFFAAKAGFRYKAALATVTTAVGLAMRGQVQYGDWLDKNSQRLGVSVERLSSYSTMIKKADSNREEFARGLAAMTARMRDAQNGSAEAARTFDDLGVEFEDAEGNLRNVDDVLRDVADRFAVTEDGATKTALAGKLLADMGAEVIVVEPPGGSPTRGYGPFAGDEPGAEQSLWWWHYNTSKGWTSWRLWWRWIRWTSCTRPGWTG